jgi:large subunit ribosomal protein L4
MILDTISFDDVKTKQVVKMMDNLKLSKALIVMPEADKNVVLSARNIPDVKTTQVGKLNVYDILNNGTVVITKDAAQKIEEVYA